MKFLLVTALVLSLANATDSFIKLRIQKEKVQQILQRNLHLFVRNARDISLTDFSSNCEEPSLFSDAKASLAYQSGFIPDSQIEVLFDESSIMVEHHELQIDMEVALGQSTDQKIIKVKIPLQSSNLVLIPQQEVKGTYFYPRFMVGDLNLVFNHENVTYEDMLTLENPEQIKKNIQSTLTNLANQLKGKLQIQIDSLLQKIQYDFQNSNECVWRFSLADPLKLTDQFLEIHLQNTLSCLQQHSAQRQVYPQFSDVESQVKDLQLVIDENFFNNWLLFNEGQTFGMRESILSIIPPHYKNARAYVLSMLRAQMMASIMTKFVKVAGTTQPMDLKCRLEGADNHLSFHENNLIDSQIHVNCSIIYYNKTFLYYKMPLFEENEWIEWRKLDVQWKNQIGLKLISNQYLEQTKLAFSEASFDFPIFEVFNQHGVDQKLESSVLKNKIQLLMKEMVQNQDETPFLLFQIQTMLNCWGLELQSPLMETKEGFLRLGFQIQVTQAEEICFKSKEQQKKFYEVQ